MASGVGPSALWYLTRGTGAVTLMLLTVSVALGVADVRRAHSEHIPRFVIDALHRSASLLAVAFLAVHIVTSVLDPFAPIRLIDAAVPFVSAYRPIWLGLGAVASDLLLALVLTSLLRRRLGHGAWRTTHWLAYACWPVALVHGLGTGSDVKSFWLLILTGLSILTVMAAVWIRVAASWADHVRTRLTAVVASVAAPIALVAWLPNGPLAPGWAKRAGTPSSLLSARGSTARYAPSVTGVNPAAPLAFSTSVTGTMTQSPAGTGLVRIELRLALSRRPFRVLTIELDGQPDGGGGVQMVASSVTLGTTTTPGAYTGSITALDGTNIQAELSGARGRLTLLALLRIDQSTGAVTGTLTSRPVATR